MIKVNITKQSNYPVSSTSLRKNLKEFLTKNGIVSNAEVSVAIVGEARMLQISNKYLKDKEVHNVLSFTPEEVQGEFVYPPDGVIHLGEIIVCYPKAFEEAKKGGMLIQDKVWELIKHGALHLLGVHHE